jgi:hypothetical protein
MAKSEAYLLLSAPGITKQSHDINYEKTAHTNNCSVYSNSA